MSQDYNTTIRSTGKGDPASGTGTEVYWDAANNIAILQGIDRTAGALFPYKKTAIRGMPVQIVDENGNIMLVAGGGVQSIDLLGGNFNKLRLDELGRVVLGCTTRGGTGETLVLDVNGNLVWDAGLPGSAKRVRGGVPGMCHAYATAAQSIPNNAWTAVSRNATRYATLDFGGDAYNYVVPAGEDGYYDIWALLNWTTNATGNRGVAVNKGGSADPYHFLAQDMRPACNGLATVITVTCKDTYLVAGDKIRILAFQSSGAALNLQLSASPHEQNQEVSIVRLGS